MQAQQNAQQGGADPIPSKMNADPGKPSLGDTDSKLRLSNRSFRSPSKGQLTVLAFQHR